MGTVGTPTELTKVVPYRIGLGDFYCLGLGAVIDGKLRGAYLIGDEDAKLIGLQCTSVANAVWTSTKDIAGWATISALQGYTYLPEGYVAQQSIPLSTSALQYVLEQSAQLVGQRFNMLNYPFGTNAVLSWLYLNIGQAHRTVYGLVGNSLSDGILAGFSEDLAGGGSVYYYIQNTDSQGYKRYLYLQCSVDGLNGYVEDARWTTIMPEGGSNWQALEVTDQQFNELRAAYNLIGNGAIKLKYEHS